MISVRATDPKIPSYQYDIVSLYISDHLETRNFGLEWLTGKTNVNLLHGTLNFYYPSKPKEITFSYEFDEKGRIHKQIKTELAPQGSLTPSSIETQYYNYFD